MIASQSRAAWPSTSSSSGKTWASGCASRWSRRESSASVIGASASSALHARRCGPVPGLRDLRAHPAVADHLVVRPDPGSHHRRSSSCVPSSVGTRRCPHVARRERRCHHRRSEGLSPSGRRTPGRAAAVHYPPWGRHPVRVGGQRAAYVLGLGYAGVVRDPGADPGRVAHGPGSTVQIDSKSRSGVGHPALAGQLPGGQHRGEVRGVADDRPLAPHRRVRGQVDHRRCRPPGRWAPRRSRRTPWSTGRSAGQLGPALLGGAVEPLLLEAAEDHRPLGPGAALVLDRPRQREQRGLPQPLRLQVRVPAAQRGVHRRRRGRRSASASASAIATSSRTPASRRRSTCGDELDVALVVAAVPAVEPLRRGSRGGTPTSAASPASGRCGRRGRRWSAGARTAAGLRRAGFGVTVGA